MADAIVKFLMLILILAVLEKGCAPKGPPPAPVTPLVVPATPPAPKADPNAPRISSSQPQAKKDETYDLLPILCWLLVSLLGLGAAWALIRMKQETVDIDEEALLGHHDAPDVNKSHTGPGHPHVETHPNYFTHT